MYCFDKFRNTILNISRSITNKYLFLWYLSNKKKTTNIRHDFQMCGIYHKKLLQDKKKNVFIRSL